ncbi:CotH kinase family protein [Marinoscillum sp.]|uniref:CotH kinase family protein n=1 Tax=Marinoscillum sp. TaxID=2024838 RepID=UPI003BAA7B8F
MILHFPAGLKTTICLLLIVLFFPEILPAQQIIINEVMASNTTFRDEDGDTPDWLELFNTGSTAVDLSGFGLSDEKESAWIFENVVIAPGGYQLLFASDKDRKNPPLYWETLIDLGDTWKYIVPQAPIADWTSPSFDDSNWSSGPSGFGYGDNDDNTELSQAGSVFLRKTFQVNNLADLQQVVLHMDYDDGFIAYLNGTEIARSNLTSADFDAFASPDHEAQLYSGGSPEAFEIADFSSILTSGENILCVQVHNVNATSSDLSAIPFLSVGKKSPSETGLSSFLTAPSNSLHTDFKISADGETIYLFGSDGVVIDSLFTGPMRANISIGHPVDDLENLLYFTEPTPGTANSSQGYQYFSEEVSFSRKGGSFSDSFQLSLSSGGSAESIYYTTSGADPDLSNAALYTGPITINKTTVVKAVVIKENSIPVNVSASTYLLNANHSLPVVSVSTDPHHLWDEHEGIYVMGPNAESNIPHYGANFWQDWEKPVHIELYEPDGTQAFSLAAGTKIFGAWSRASAQKSLAIFARKSYGAEAINYQVFPDLAMNHFNSLVLRNSGNDWNSSMFRDGFMTSLFHETVDRQAFRPAVLYLNGEYWGIQNIREKVNEDFLANHHNLDPDDIIILEANGASVEGDPSSYHDLIAYIADHDLAEDEHYEYVQNHVDVFNFTQYQIGNIFIDNTDWPGNNIKFWKENKPGAKWRWITYDTDFGFGVYGGENYYNNTLSFALDPNGPGWPNPAWSTFLLRNLLKNENFKNLFINSFADQLNTALSTAETLAKITALSNEIAPEIASHMSRWDGDYNNWLYQVSVMKTFAENRPQYVRQHIRSQFGLSGEHTLTVKSSNPNLGAVQVNSLVTNKSDWKGIYFQGVPVRLSAFSHGGKFVRWEGDVTGTQPEIFLDLTKNMTVTAVFETGSGNDIVINEINYKSGENLDTEDWVELHNPNNAAMDLSGWVFKDGDDENSFTIPDGTVIDAGGYLVIAKDLGAYSSFHSTAHNVLGELEFGFSGDGECLRLFDPNGETIDEVCYLSSTPWPEAPAGGGSSLALDDPSLDNSLSESWYAHPNGGTPGYANKEVTLGVTTPSTPVICYPNPASDHVFFSFSSHQQMVTLSILDLSGRALIRESIHLKQTGLVNYEWKVPAIENGVYLIEITTQHGVQHGKLLIQK